MGPDRRGIRLALRATGVLLLACALVLAASLIVAFATPADMSPLYLCTNATGDACRLQAAGPWGFAWVRAVVELGAVAVLVAAAAVLLVASARSRRPADAP